MPLRSGNTENALARIRKRTQVSLGASPVSGLKRPRLAYCKPERKAYMYRGEAMKQER